MPANRVHLVRHAEVNNPTGVIYERLPHFAITDRGHEMARLAAKSIQQDARRVTALFSSPLLRTRESAEHLQAALGVDLQIDERLVEAGNSFAGERVGVGLFLRKPQRLWRLRNPLRPSWGEPYSVILERMLAAIDAAADSVYDGEVVLVSHQLPIVMVQRHLAGLPLPHHPSKRECALSSVTVLQRDGRGWVQVDYREPAGTKP